MLKRINLLFDYICKKYVQRRRKKDNTDIDTEKYWSILMKYWYYYNQYCLRLHTDIDTSLHYMLLFSVFFRYQWKHWFTVLTLRFDQGPLKYYRALWFFSSFFISKGLMKLKSIAWIWNRLNEMNTWNYIIRNFKCLGCLLG